MLGDSHCVLFCPATDVCSPAKKRICSNNFVSPRLISDEPPNPPGLFEDRTNTTVAYFLSQAVRIIVFPLFHWKDIFLIITFFKCIGGNDPKKTHPWTGDRSLIAWRCVSLLAALSEQWIVVDSDCVFIFACAFEPESRVEVKKPAEERSPPPVDKPMRKRKREETVQPVEEKFSGPRQTDKPMRKRKREETVQPIEEKFSGPKSGLKG